MGIGELTRVAPSTMAKSRLSSMRLYLIVKRLLDVVVSAFALAILSPVLLVIAIAIKLDSPGSVIFKQKRVRGNQDPDGPPADLPLFEFYKFRSMYVNSDAEIHQRFVKEYINGDVHKTNNGNKEKPLYKMRNDPRITRIGRLLRRSSLDELPQLVNVLKGDMSLVGPRPALPYEVEQYTRFHRQRLVPQAGLTGLWQVNGRTSLTFDEMIDLDIEYTRNRSLWLDVRILLKTLPAILSGVGAW